MASVKELLLNSLKELENSNLKVFQWHLKNYEHIFNSELENADRCYTVDKMVACFGPQKAWKITVEILRKMNQNDLAERLENKCKQGNISFSVLSLSLSHTHTHTHTHISQIP